MDAQWTEYGATFQWFISDLMEPLCPFRKKKKKINISLQQTSQRKLLMSGSTGRREYTTFNLSLCFLILLVHHLPVEDFNSVEVKHIWLIPSRCSFPAHHSSFHSLKVKTEHSIPKFTLLLGCICAAMLLQTSRFVFFLIVFSWTFCNVPVMSDGYDGWLKDAVGLYVGKCRIQCVWSLTQSGD